MSSIGTIRKQVGKPLESKSPFIRLEYLRINAAPFAKNKKHDDSDSIIIRKTVGPPR